MNIALFIHYCSFRGLTLLLLLLSCYQCIERPQRSQDWSRWDSWKGDICAGRCDWQGGRSIFPGFCRLALCHKSSTQHASASRSLPRRQELHKVLQELHTLGLGNIHDDLRQGADMCVEDARRDFPQMSPLPNSWCGIIKDLVHLLASLSPEE